MKEVIDRDHSLQLQTSSLQKVEHSLRNLRIADLELFIRAAQMKNLGKSASFHHLSQSAASAAIKRVEAAFGTALCTHEKRQFRLTREGQVLLPRLESWIAQLQNLKMSQEQITIRFVTTHAIAQIAVPALLSIEKIEFKHMRPDHAYAAILQDEADIALVLDNASWKGVIYDEIGKGFFQLYSRKINASLKPVLLPEDQMEVLSLQQSWQQKYGYLLPIKARISSWSLIASICRESDEVGFLPDFLAKKFHLHPVIWQPANAQYRILAIYRNTGVLLQKRFKRLLDELRPCFATNYEDNNT